MRFFRIAVLGMTVGMGVASAARGDPPPAHRDGRLVVFADADLVADDFAESRARGGPAVSINGVGGFALVAAVVDDLLDADPLPPIAADGLDPDVPPAGAAALLAAGPARVDLFVYWSRDLPASAARVEASLRRRLEAWTRASAGRLHVRWVVPTGTEAEAARGFGLEEAEFAEVTASEFQRVRGFAGLVVAAGTTTTPVDRLIELDAAATGAHLARSFDRRLARALHRATTPPARVLVVAGAVDASTPRAARPPTFRRLVDVLTSPDAPAPRALSALDATVAEDVGVVVVAGPRRWPAEAVARVEAFLARGGRVLLLLDPVDLATAFGGVAATPSGFEGWLGRLGVTVAEGVVGEVDAAARSQVLAESGTLAAYPFWPRVAHDRIDATLQSTAGLGDLSLYFPGALRVDAAAAAAAGRRTRPLLWSTPHAWLTPLDTAWTEVAPTPDGPLGERVFAVEVAGPFAAPPAPR